VPVEVENAKGSQNLFNEVNKNVEARIRNPLKGIPEDLIFRHVEALAAEKDLLEHLAVLKQGALLAQDSVAYQNSHEMSNTTQEALSAETKHKWRQPMALYVTIILGWDQTGSNGANLSFPLALGIDDSDGAPNAQRNSWIIGLINSGPYIGASLCGCWCSSPLNDLFARRGTIFVAAIFCLFSVLGSAFCQTWPQLLICRLLLGFGMGVKASTIPIFAAENSPASIRGGLVMTWQMWTAFGILMGTTFNLALYQVGDLAWRLQLGSAFIPAVPLALGIYFCPESPCWYMKKGRYRDAYKSLCRLRNAEIQAARDLYYIHAQLEIEAEVVASGNFVVKLVVLFTIPRVRRATLASFTVMIAQQMCGISIIAFYSSTVFSAAGSTTQVALLASFGFGLVSFFFTFPAFRTIDSFGRRSLLLFTFPQMAWTLLAAGFCTYIPGIGSVHVGMVAFFVYLFSAFYACGEGPVPFAYSAEVFPLSHREIGMSWASSTTFFWATVLSLTFPRMLRAMGLVGAFGFYAGLNVVAFVLIFLFMPETKQLTLEELDYVFGVPTHIHIAYQVKKALPYYMKRWVSFHKKATLEPLHRLDGSNTCED
ncbi:polyol transporter 1, partial [Hyphodiscus hymeniophilus]